MLFRNKNKRIIRKINSKILGDFTLIYDYIPESDITQISCEVNCGSYHEGSVDVPPGTAHFIEHMVFNGSKTFDKESLLKIRENGADINAYTSHKATTYYVEFLTNDDFTSILTKFISMIFNPMFDEEEIEKERSIIKDEIRGTMGNPLHTHLDNVALGFENKDFRNPIGGTLESVKEIHKDDLVKFHSKLYKTSNTIMYISSSKSISYIEKCLTNIFIKFANLNTMVDNNDIIINTNNMFLGYKPLHTYKTDHPVSLIQFTYLFPRDLFYKLLFINDIYSNGMGSILWNSLRERKPLCYNYHSNITMISDRKITYNIIVECNKENLKEIEEVINSTFHNLYSTILNNKYMVESSYKRFYSSYCKIKLNPLKEDYMSIPFNHRLNIIGDKDIMKIYKKFNDDREYLLEEIDFDKNPLINISLEK